MNKTVMLIALLLTPIASIANDQNDDGTGGRWVPSGTFAISNLPNNKSRERTYSKASLEQNRISSFLPGMTIIYRWVPSATRAGYLEGITHSGILVKVLESELSKGLFNKRDAKDVVVHRSHTGCRDLACDGDPVEIGIGHAFKIDREDDEKIELLSTNEQRVVYSTSNFNKKETSGYLTRHKGRENPRWSIFDGYAKSVSAGCGRAIENIGFKLGASASKYNSAPSSWDLNDDTWSLKAIEIFDLGTIEKDLEDDSRVIGQLHAPIKDQELEFSAVDLTVLAYRDSSWKKGHFKFAGLLQILHCEDPPIGQSKPTYVKEAYIYFDKREGDNYVQSFPLSRQELPRQFSETDQKTIFHTINRSFYYSINSPGDYADVFDNLSKIIPIPTAVANVIARTNGSCGENDRKKCRAYSKFQSP